MAVDRQELELALGELIALFLALPPDRRLNSLEQFSGLLEFMTKVFRDVVVAEGPAASAKKG